MTIRVLKSLRGAAVAGLLYGLSFCYAETVDTAFIATASPGPYALGRRFVDSASIRVSLTVPPSPDSTQSTALPQDPVFTYVNELNAILFGSIVDSGTVVRVHYDTDFGGLDKIYSLYERRFASADSTSTTTLASTPGIAALWLGSRSSDSLTISGYQQFGVELASSGALNMNQALEVRLFGMVDSTTRISANLSDRGSSLDGTTRELNDFDRVYIALENPRYALVVGDHFQTWRRPGILAGSKKLKGIAARYTPNLCTLAVFGAIGRGTFATEIIRPQDGVAGPYALHGNGESSMVMPVAGTVQVSVNGVPIQIGEEGAVLINYDLGTILFTPQFFVRSTDIVKVEYEYITAYYQRLSGGFDMHGSRPDSTLKAWGTIWYEGDDHNTPLDRTFSATEVDSLRSAGDRAPRALAARLLDPNDVAREQALTPLYTRDSSGNFVYTPFDPHNPGDRQGFYRIDFHEQAGGTYALDTIDYRGPVYTFVGAGQGTVTPYSLLPLPQRTVQGELFLRAAPVPWGALMLDVAGTSRDRNVFSALDDDNNNGLALKSSLRLGTERLDRFSVYGMASYAVKTAVFETDVVSLADRLQQWDDPSNFMSGATDHYLQMTAGMVPLPQLQLAASYGRLIRNDSTRTEKIAGTVRVPLGANNTAIASANLFVHPFSDTNGWTRRDTLGLIHKNRLFDGAARFGDEWRSAQSSQGRGMLFGEITATVRALKLSEKFVWSSARRGTGDVVMAADTGFALWWQQSIEHVLGPSWTVGGSSTLSQQAVFGRANRTSAALLITHALAPLTGLSTTQSYALHFERSAQQVQVPVYVGEGLGTHYYDDTLRNYIPRSGAAYIVSTRSIPALDDSRRMRSTDLRAEWSFEPSSKSTGGILDDCTWRGDLLVTEQVADNDSLPAQAWLPGYASLSRGSLDTLVRLSRCSYRQSVTWRSPVKTEDYQASLFAMPLVMIGNGTRESGLEGGATAQLRLSPLTWRLDGTIMHSQREDVGRLLSGVYDLDDRHVTLTQEYPFWQDVWILTVDESVGWAQRSSSAAINNGWYYRLRPGIIWQNGLHSRLSLSYNIVQVNILPPLDYRMALGNGSGLTQVVEGSAAINIGSHVTLSGHYRSEWSARTVADGFEQGLHTLAVQGRAYF